MGQRANILSLKKQFKYLENSNYFLSLHKGFYFPVFDFLVRKHLTQLFKQNSIYLNNIYLFQTEKKFQIILKLTQQKDFLYELFLIYNTIYKLKRHLFKKRKINKLGRIYIKKLFFVLNLQKKFHIYNKLLTKTNLTPKLFEQLKTYILSYKINTELYSSNKKFLTVPVKNNTIFYQTNQYLFKKKISNISTEFQILKFNYQKNFNYTKFKYQFLFCTSNIIQRSRKKFKYFIHLRGYKLKQGSLNLLGKRLKSFKRKKKRTKYSFRAKRKKNFRTKKKFSKSKKLILKNKISKFLKLYFLFSKKFNSFNLIKFFRLFKSYLLKKHISKFKYYKYHFFLNKSDIFFPKKNLKLQKSITLNIFFNNSLITTKYLNKKLNIFLFKLKLLNLNIKNYLKKIKKLKFCLKKKYKNKLKQKLKKKLFYRIIYKKNFNFKKKIYLQNKKLTFQTGNIVENNTKNLYITPQTKYFFTLKNKYKNYLHFKNFPVKFSKKKNFKTFILSKLKSKKKINYKNLNFLINNFLLNLEPTIKKTNKKSLTQFEKALIYYPNLRHKYLTKYFTSIIETRLVYKYKYLYKTEKKFTKELTELCSKYSKFQGNKKQKKLVPIKTLNFKKKNKRFFSKGKTKKLVFKRIRISYKFFPNLLICNKIISKYNNNFLKKHLKYTTNKYKINNKLLKINTNFKHLQTQFNKINLNYQKILNNSKIINLKQQLHFKYKFFFKMKKLYIKLISRLFRVKIRRFRKHFWYQLNFKFKKLKKKQLKNKKRVNFFQTTILNKKIYNNPLFFLKDQLKKKKIFKKITKKLYNKVKTNKNLFFLNKLSLCLSKYLKKKKIQFIIYHTNYKFLKKYKKNLLFLSRYNPKFNSLKNLSQLFILNRFSYTFNQKIYYTKLKQKYFTRKFFKNNELFLCLFNCFFNRLSTMYFLQYLSLLFKKIKKHNIFLDQITKILTYFFKQFYKKLPIKGFKLIIKGRINGKPRKKLKLIQFGTLNTQTFNTKLDSTKLTAFTKYGTFGLFLIRNS